ncbi:MAG: amidase, partial [Acidimicrobiia bacterium]|nr:amidase [Acidimicrobiia bacterium]
MSEPWELTACAARDLIGRGELSPVELLESCLHRIDDVDPAVNALVIRADERARAEARAAADALVRGAGTRGGGGLGPLH